MHSLHALAPSLIPHAQKKNTPPNPLQPISYTSKAFVEATHWQSAPFKAFMATLNAQATWESKSITTYTEADAGF